MKLVDTNEYRKPVSLSAHLVILKLVETGQYRRIFCRCSSKWRALSREIRTVGTVKEARLLFPGSRMDLGTGRQQHWNTLFAGRDHLGYQRKEGAAAGRWLLRQRRNGKYTIEEIGIADDIADDAMMKANGISMKADGISILNYEQARDKALKMAANGARPAGRLTVERAMGNYIDDLKMRGKNTAAAESCAVTWILPELGHHEVVSLTASTIQAWVAWVAGILSDLPLDEEQQRRRKVSANRHLSVLKAALTRALKDGHVSSDVAWKSVTKYTGVDPDNSELYLQKEEAKQFLDACDDVFRPLARAALETGARYGELAGLRVANFNKDSGTIFVRKSKAARQRHVYLTPEKGVPFFSDVTAGRSASEWMFTKADGMKWTHGAQNWYVAHANAGAGIDPPITFHKLRHTWASWAVMGGVPLTVVAEQLGHVDTRMVEKVYGHLAKNYISEEIRAGAPRW